MVSLGLATLGSLRLYETGMIKLMRLFPDRWAVLLTTDVVVRSERWAAIRERFERDRPRGFDESMPWDAVIAASAYGVERCALAVWWQDYFILPNSLASSAGAASSRIAVVEDAPRPKRSRSRSRGNRGSKRASKKQSKDTNKG